MSSEKSEDNSFFSKTLDQGIQTEEHEEVDLISVSTSPRLPLPRDLRHIDDAVTVFEFCKVCHETETPESILISRTDTEDSLQPSITQPTRKSSNIEELSNRYKYCKDVIAPYFSYVDHNTTESKTLKSPENYSIEDYSYFNPCLQGFDARSESQITFHSNPIITKVDVKTSTNMSEEANTSKPPCVPKPGDDRAQCPPRPQQEESEESTRKVHKKPCGKVEKEIKICTKHYETGERRNTCPPKVEKEKCKKSNCDKHQITQPYVNLVDSLFRHQHGMDRIIDNHIQTVSTIKLAMDDFMDKVCESSKDAIALIAGESMKQLEKLKKTDTVTKCCDHKCRATTIELLQDVQIAKEMNLNMRDEFSQAFEKFMRAVDSTLSTFQNGSHNVETLPTAMISPNFPLPEEYSKPQMFSDDANTTAQSTNVFSAIKSRIFSMFSDSRIGSPALAIVQQPLCTGKKSLDTSTGSKGMASDTHERREHGTLMD